MVAVLHNVRSIHNVGSIFRTADGAGVRKIYLCGITPGPVDRFGREVKAFVKVSLGAEETVAYEKIRQTTEAIRRLKKEGYTILAIEQSRNSVPYHKFKIPRSKPRIALILGAEVEGVPPAILKMADKILEIPMRGVMVREAYHPRHSGRGKESLNVAIAFGIVAYRLTS